MLFLIPLGFVPFAVTAGVWLGTLPDYVSRRSHASRLLLAFGNSWHALAPVLVLSVVGVTKPELGHWPILLAAFVSQLLLDAIVSTVRDWAGLGISPRLQPALIAWAALVDAALTPVGLLAAIAAGAAGWGAALLLLPLLALIALFAGEREARIAHALELSRAYRGTTLLLGDVLEADDEYTGLHSRSVVSLSVSVADELGLDPHERRNVEFGALLHDVGKIAVPNEIINKPGPLTDDEWLVIKAHTIEGQRMLDQVGGLLSEVGRVVRSSHERWDGSGYPDGLKGVEIPLSSAIVSCCDAVNAMTTDRPYRPARTLEQAIEELIAESGKQFNPLVVGALTRILARSLAGHQPLEEEPPARRIGILSQPVPVE
jgi:putative nucleotidyltransferase with HDIG domain